MADMEVHEHVVVEGTTARLKNPLIHHNVESLSRYIQKHDEYSNWEAGCCCAGEQSWQRDCPGFALRNPGATPALAQTEAFRTSGFPGACFSSIGMFFALVFSTACRA